MILWPDTFNNHLHPEVGKATVEVLEAAGYQVLIPAASLCCGRPLYDFGMLDTAKDLLRQILDTLRPQIQAGIPVVGMEPSCVAVFRDELLGLFPDDEDAAAAAPADVSVERVPEQEGERLSPAATPAQGASSTATAITRPS